VAARSRLSDADLVRLERELQEAERTDPVLREAARKYEEGRDRILGRRFFQHGQVSLAGLDKDGRKAALRICIPCCLMHAATPVLLGAGVIDGYEVMNPMSVWLPALSEERFKEQGQDAVRTVNREVRQSAERAAQMFRDAGRLLKDPSDLVPLLPMGTYVTFLYRCRVDALADVLTGLDAMPVAGVKELRYAVASVLASVLKELGDVASLPGS
jgi:hypothetical protein